MKGLERIEKDIYSIRDYLAKDDEISKLLFYPTRNALQRDNVSASLINEYIFLSPVFDTTREPFDKNTFISITLANTEWNDEDGTHMGAFRINVFSEIDLWELDEDRVRPLAILSKMIEILDQKKLKSSHKLFYISSDLTTLDKNIAGYTALFGIVDGGGDSDEELY